MITPRHREVWELLQHEVADVVVGVTMKGPKRDGVCSTSIVAKTDCNIVFAQGYKKKERFLWKITDIIR